jgi:RHS repeat-associated protein
VDGTLYYVHSDLLGSTVALSDAAGQAAGRVLYDPYGEVLTSTLPVTLTDRLFTGQRLDSSSGLYYYNARYYDPYLGRFIQPDTLVPDPLNPQAWNRFSYCYNNPVSYVDPSGHIPFWDVLDVASFAWSSYELYREPSWANLGWWALDVVSLLPLIPSIGLLRHGDKAVDLLRAAGRVEDVGDARRILVVGENSFEYSQALRRTLGAEYDIVATSLHTSDELIEMGLNIPKREAGFKVMHRVDATDLARYFGPGEFDLIIFNNPRAVKWGQGAAGDLIEGVLRSAPDVLRAGGEVRFGVAGGRGLGVYRLRGIARSGRYGPFTVNVAPFISDVFGVAYRPMSTGGKPLPFGVNVMDWYRFILPR